MRERGAALRTDERAGNCPGRVFGKKVLQFGRPSFWIGGVNDLRVERISVGRGSSDRKAFKFVQVRCTYAHRLSMSNIMHL